MNPPTIGILHPGEMGSTTGRVLRERGLRTICALDGRSARTQEFARAAGLEDVGTVARLAAEADVVLAILVPAKALDQAQAYAAALPAALSATGRGNKPLPVYADCNAISLDTMRAIAETIAAAGGRCVDAGIVGPPPRRPGTTRFYASAPDAEALAALTALNEHGLDVRPVGDAIGQASLFKTCYASLTKGLSALAAIQLTAAELAGLSGALRDEMEQSQPALWPWMQRVVPGMPAKAHRWIAEMDEHADTFRALGLPGEMMQGAANLYRLVAASPAGRDGAASAQPSLDEMARALAGSIKPE